MDDNAVVDPFEAIYGASLLPDHDVVVAAASAATRLGNDGS
jgi:hypothetical protein